MLFQVRLVVGVGAPDRQSHDVEQLVHLLIEDPRTPPNDLVELQHRLDVFGEVLGYPAMSWIAASTSLGEHLCQFFAL